MELVQGLAFRRYVQCWDQWPPPAQAIEERAPTELELARARSALRQLALGLRALHRAGKVHRDLKPANVLVSRDDRLVILDLGLVFSLRDPGFAGRTQPGLAGSLAYMAPAQLRGAEPSPAADWYAVGVMLYEALTGVRPFGDDREELLASRRGTPARPPRELRPGIPPELDELCTALLSFEAADRPGADDVIARLGDVDVPGAAVRSPTALPLDVTTALGVGGEFRAPFVGRDDELEFLHQALGEVTAGAAVAVVIDGAEGVGKSALMLRFLEHAFHGGAVILPGRCYERESVRLKALDSLVDHLSRHLRALPEAEAYTLLPDDVDTLCRMFPVLGRVAAVRARRAGVEPPAAAGGAPRRGSLVLRELLQRMGRRAPLVLCIDDLHWGDPESAALLNEALSPPDPPRALLLACRRTDAGPGPPLALGGVPARTLTLEERVWLPPESAKDIARELRAAVELGNVSKLGRIATRLGVRQGGTSRYRGKLERLAAGLDLDGLAALADELERDARGR